MRIVITGGDGLIGKNIAPYLTRHHECFSLTASEWDVTDEEAGRRVIRELNPDLVINLAAITDVDLCEDEIELAERVNVYGAECVARLCAEYGIGLVHFSTDYVFNGKKGSPYTEDDTPEPLSVYGRTKLESEKKVRNFHPSPLIIRTQWVYGDGGKNFITKVLDAAKKKDRIEVVNDQFGSPTYAADLAEPLELLFELKKSGIYHVANSGICSWYDLAKEVFRIKKISVDLVPVSSEEIKRRAKRPPFSALSTEKLKKDTGFSLRPWKEALEEYLTQL